MAKVEIILPLLEEIERKFKGESHKIIDFIESLEKNPHKGKAVGQVGGIVIKELRYKSFRFYFVTDGHKLKFFNEEILKDLLIKFVRMSNKRDQQKAIDEIKEILKNISEGGF